MTLPAALAEGAVVLLRTWVDDLPDEAKAITTLFLADAAAAALTLDPGREWAALIDEFGGVLSTGAGERALALMQRARSAGGQVAVTTQSISDFAAATGNTALLDAMADNFAGGIFHRQASPESRDWLARLIGTRELWQSTERTTFARADGTGSRRRVREFLVRPDELRTFTVGEAIIWSALGPAPEQLHVTAAALPATDAPPADTTPVYRACGPTALPDTPVGARARNPRAHPHSAEPVTSRDDFFEQLARDRYPGPQVVYDGPDGTARRSASRAPRRPASRRVAPVRRGPSERSRAHAAAVVAITVLPVCTVAVVLLSTSSSTQPGREAARSHPAPGAEIAATPSSRPRQAARRPVATTRPGTRPACSPASHPTAARHPPAAGGASRRVAPVRHGGPAGRAHPAGDGCASSRAALDLSQLAAAGGE